jgi:two-component system, sensor histidine kinase and response regulator
VPETSDRRRILIAEDEQVVALDVESGLDELGYEVVGVVSSAPEAVRLTEETRPDLVLMDIQLGGPTDGITAAEEIRRRWQIPVVFVTASAGHEIVSRAKAAGPYGYITKPFRTKELKGTIAVALERHRLTRDLERSNTELTTFCYAVSHDLQAPVRTIRTLVALLSNQLQSALSTEQFRLIDLVIRATDNMQHLIESLLQYAQIGHGQLNRQMVSSSEIVAAVKATLAPLIAERNAEITCSACSMVSADPVQFQQLLQNLITNAIKYSQPGQPPRITISSETTEEDWHFAVTDNGCGIPPEKHETVFEPLSRLHGAEIPGTGMGLALCRTIVERHGGRIWVETPAIGEGVTFHFVLGKPKETVGQNNERFGAPCARP